MYRQLCAIEEGLQKLDATSRVLPSPREMEALQSLRYKLPIVIELCAAYKPKAWERIHAWQATPYSPPVRLIRAIISFIAAFILGAVVIYAGGLWVLDKFLPMPYSYVISAVLSFIATILIIRSERS